ncbi:MAG: ABC transporter permease [Chloroflexi bacterium]|nr:ABC transporter permease [Chloroflexota bacterium]
MRRRILGRSFRNRKARLALAMLSVVLGASLVAALVNLSLDIPQKASSQLRAYGANILVLPAAPPGSDVAYIPESGLGYLEGADLAPSIVGYTPYLYGQVEIDGQRVVLAGVRLDTVARTSPWWRVTGGGVWEVGSGMGAVVGAQVAEKLQLALDREFSVKYGNNIRTFRVAGIVSTGAAEESQVFVDLKAAQELMALEGKVGLVQVSALTGPRPLSQLSQLIEQGMPGVEARVMGQIASAEARVLGKVQLLMALVAALILIASGLVILSTMTTTLLERTTEIGLMKALGASDLRVAELFGAEIGIIAAGSGVVGYLLGYMIALFIGRQVFASSVSPRPAAFLVTLASAILVTLVGSTPPLRRAMKIDPALTLRGE